jgi:hypothetical protein
MSKILLLLRISVVSHYSHLVDLLQWSFLDYWASNLKEVLLVLLFLQLKSECFLWVLHYYFALHPLKTIELTFLIILICPKNFRRYIKCLPSASPFLYKWSLSRADAAVLSDFLFFLYFCVVLLWSVVEISFKAYS